MTECLPGHVVLEHSKVASLSDEIDRCHLALPGCRGFLFVTKFSNPEVRSDQLLSVSESACPCQGFWLITRRALGRLGK